MTGSYEHLLAHLRHAEKEFFCLPIAGDSWDEVRLRLELAASEYAALPVVGKGWLVLTQYPLPLRCLEVGTSWEDLLGGFAEAEGVEGIVLSEGWAAAACRERHAANV
jgi:hypothetical protein